MEVLGIDIGGSALKGAPVDTHTGKLLAERFRIPSPAVLTPARMARDVREIVKHFAWKGPVGMGFPGVIHGPTILTSANLHQDFIGRDGVKLFSRAAGRKVSLLNDAAAAGLAEMKFGAGRKFQGKVLLLTLGTGVGSALFYEGVVFACEFGHLPMKGKSAEKFVAASVKESHDLSWEKWGKRLGKYIGILERVLWPELIIIGGGVSAKSEKFFPYLHCRAKVVPAQFFNEAGIVGAALSAVEKT